MFSGAITLFLMSKAVSTSNEWGIISFGSVLLSISSQFSACSVFWILKPRRVAIFFELLPLFYGFKEKEVESIKAI